MSEVIELALFDPRFQGTREEYEVKLWAKLSFLAISLYCGTAVAAEVDSFSNRSLHDVSPEINDVINSALQTAIDLTNETGREGCNPQLLVDALGNDFLGGGLNLGIVTKIFESRIEQAREMKIYQVPGKKLFWQAAASGTSLINFRGTYIGLDKLDHFFLHGFQYFLKYKELSDRSNKVEVDEILQIGMDQENGKWGLTGTGVKSYGDLSANWYGFTFWKDFFEGDKSRNIPPILGCVNSKYVLTKKIDLSDCVNDSWDEAINCSSYFSKIFKHDVFENIKKNSQWDTCPIIAEKCEDLTRSLPSEISKRILHPKCFDPKTSDSSFVESPRKGFWSAIRENWNLLFGFRGGKIPLHYFH